MKQGHFVGALFIIQMFACLERPVSDPPFHVLMLECIPPWVHGAELVCMAPMKSYDESRCSLMAYFNGATYVHFQPR